MELIHYRTADGDVPFKTWHSALRDKSAKARIAMRLRSLQQGNLGDCKPVGEGVLELRVHVGAGYRVYCARYGQTLVVLLCGGDKSSQARDVRLARSFWREWKKEQRS